MTPEERSGRQWDEYIHTAKKVTKEIAEILEEIE